jgi:hypothetical protein
MTQSLQNRYCYGAYACLYPHSSAAAAAASAVQGSDVTCILCPRQGGMEETVLQVRLFEKGGLLAINKGAVVIPLQLVPVHSQQNIRCSHV